MSNFTKLKTEQKVPIYTQMVENTSLSVFFFFGKMLIMRNCFVCLEQFLKDKYSQKEGLGLTNG